MTDQGDKVRVHVVGDFMVDETLRPSRECVEQGGTNVYAQKGLTEVKLGGAGNVAALIMASPEATASVDGLFIHDDSGITLLQLFQVIGVDMTDVRHMPAVAGSGLVTTVKTRMLDYNEAQIARLDNETIEVTPELSELLADAQRQALRARIHRNEIDVLLLSDYGKGGLPDPSALIDMARNEGIPVVVDPKGKDFKKYMDATVLTPNRMEFDAEPSYPPGEDKPVTMVWRLGLLGLLITEGKYGMSLYQPDHKVIHIDSDIKDEDVRSVVGAGDAVAAQLAISLGMGDSVYTACKNASAAAAKAIA